MEENKNEKTIKKGNGGIKAIVAIIIIAILAGVAYYFLRPTAPKDVFVAGINSALDKSSQKIGEDVDKINTTIILSGNIESNDEEAKQVAEYVNEGKLTYNVQVDRSAKKVAMSANVDYKNENLLSGKLFYEDGDDNVYFYIQDLFDKYFKFNLKDTIDDEEDISIIKDMFNEEKSSKADTKKATNIIKTTIESNLKDEFFSKEKDDGITRNIMKLTIGDLKQMANNISTSLKDNEEFMNCFEKADQVKDVLENIMEEIDDIDTEYDNKIIEVSLYTKGVKNEIDKILIRTDLLKTGMLSILLEKKEDGKYELNADIPEFGKITLNIEAKNEKDTDLNNIDVSDSVDINNMSQGDMFKLYGNLMNMKIYQYIAPFMANNM